MNKLKGGEINRKQSRSIKLLKADEGKKRNSTQKALTYPQKVKYTRPKEFYR